MSNFSRKWPLKAGFSLFNRIVSRSSVLMVICWLMNAVTAIATEDTSIMFVGEDLSVLTIASRRAESPESAPAVAQVITAEEMRRNGVDTVAEALSLTQGFYILPDQRGSVPYQRGVKDGTLFLYNSVPLTADGSRAVTPLDKDVSLASIERIEVIRGPGSVLWGPDAFAGIVNIVPKRGRDVNGFEVQAQGGSPDKDRSVNLLWGKNTGLWEGFAALNLREGNAPFHNFNLVRLAGPDNMPLPFSERIGMEDLPDSRSVEGVFNLSWQDWLRFSGRWSESQRYYVLNDASSSLFWRGKRETPFRFLRMEAERSYGPSKLSLNAYYSEFDFSEQEVDLPTLSQKSRVSYAELLYDRELWNADALATLGVSYRYNTVNGAIVSKGYPPDFMVPGNIFFLPIVRQQDISTRMPSAFMQVRRHWNLLDAWCGLRMDDHEYDTTLSYNAGVSMRLSHEWQLKLLSGSAYRTPYNLQFAQKTGIKPEEIRSLSAQLLWKPLPGLNLSATGFWNHIEHHMNEDALAGLSAPVSERIAGLEWEGRWTPVKDLTLWLNGTVFSNAGDDETYSLYIKRLVGGVWVDSLYRSWDVPYDTGSDGLLNAGVNWRALKNLDLSLRVQYAHARDFYYDKGRLMEHTPSNWLAASSVTLKDWPVKKGELQWSVKNLLDNDYPIQGTYAPQHNPPFQTYLTWRWRF
ncbi:MAG: TonB-dependent receptor plug domain-containing protein [Deltaproteobacteria bacterium]|nr:TonB-dependent receptor plug domain-containing protein [Deltaproteobacteria bacterium]